MNLRTKRVLITGGRGFLGSHVIEQLKTRGVTEIFSPSHKDADLVERDTVQRLFEDIRPHLVIHLAAKAGGIGFNEAEPGSFFYENMAMGLNVIDESRRCGVEKFILIGTICSYPKHAPLPLVEDDLWNGYPARPTDPYGIAKKALMVMTDAYRIQYGFNAMTLLPTNLYGPGDNLDLSKTHVIPSLILKCLDAVRNAADHIVVWGDGTSTREFLYVEDAAKAIVLAAERCETPGPFNLGTGQEVPIRELVNLVAKLSGFTGKIVWDTTKPGGQPRRQLEISRAEREFGFKAHTSLEAGLSQTIQWYKERLR